MTKIYFMKCLALKGMCTTLMPQSNICFSQKILIKHANTSNFVHSFKKIQLLLKLKL